MDNILLTVSYDGTGFSGWQRQANAPSVQGEIERALSKLLKKNISVAGASRTDAGVHAAGQRCSFKHENINIPPDRLPYALNSILRSDVVVTMAETVPPDFHARFSAKKKSYEYKIHNGTFINPLTKNYCWHVRAQLDINKMVSASKFFLGTHDFKAFCAAGSGVLNYTRTVYALDVKTDGCTIIISITGDGFLYNMVRIIAGTLAYAGLGKIDPGLITEIIISGDRTGAGITAPPHGLTLTEIFY